MAFHNLITDTIENCVFYGFTVQLPHRYSVEGCGGFVDDSRMKFAVATKRAHWREIFLHESCHLDQFIENDPLWFDKLLTEQNFMDPDIESEEEREEVFYRTMLLEHDCDKRALKKLDLYNIKEKIVPRGPYIQAANCYHASYYYFWKHSCFYDSKHVPYNTQHLLDLFPRDRLLTPQTKWKERPLLNDFFLKYSKPL